MSTSMIILIFTIIDINRKLKRRTLLDNDERKSKDIKYLNFFKKTICKLSSIKNKL